MDNMQEISVKASFRIWETVGAKSGKCAFKIPPKIQ